MFNKPTITIEHFKTQLMNLIAEANRAGIDRDQIRAALVKADDGMKDIFRGQRRYEPPQAPVRKYGPLAQVIRRVLT